MSNREEIKKLTEIWFCIVSLDHHKDRDCHWYINEAWSYGDYPVYHVEHCGYIVSDIVITCSTREQAEIKLIAAIKTAINKQKKWATNVLKESDKWDKWDIEYANTILDKAAEVNKDGGVMKILNERLEEIIELNELLASESPLAKDAVTAIRELIEARKTIAEQSRINYLYRQEQDKLISLQVRLKEAVEEMRIAVGCGELLDDGKYLDGLYHALDILKDNRLIEEDK